MTDSLIDIDKKSELNNLPRRYKKISITRYFIYLALIVMVIWSFQGSQFSFEGLLDSTQYFKRFLGEAFPSIRYDGGLTTKVLLNQKNGPSKYDIGDSVFI